MTVKGSSKTLERAQYNSFTNISVLSKCVTHVKQGTNQE